MIDVTLETVRAIILLGIVLFLWRIGRQRFEANRKGWNLIVAGFGLLLFGSLIDITDNFEALIRFVVVGDTGMQAFLEKFVGFLGGFLVLAWGLVLWMPRTQRLPCEIGQRRRAEEALRHEREMLESRVRERTGELEDANAALHGEIAERKRAEEALRTSEQRYRELFDESPAAIWSEDWSPIKQMLDDLARSGVKDWRGYFNSHRDQLKTVYDLAKVTEITHAAIDLYRTESREELIRMSAAEVVIDDELDAFIEIVLAFLAGRMTVDIEAKDRAGDGSEIIVRLQVVVPAKYRDDWSRVMYASEDITERKRAVAEIEKRDALLHGIVTTVADAIITTDERAVITSFNPGAERIFGHGAGEVIGRNIRMLMPDEFARAHDRHVARYRGTGVSSVIGARRNMLGLRKDGTTFPMDLVMDEMTIAGQRMFTGIIRDITERREREEALRLKTTKLALMEAVASSANEITDTDAFIQSCVDNICQYFGWPVGHAYRTASDGKRVLHPMKIWHLDDPARFEVFRRITDQTSFKPGNGLPGRVMASGEPAWIVDITKDGNFPRITSGAEIGIKGAFAVP
ncbi:MAG: PAS domain S-box protein, partial [Limibaculum sp.]